MADLKFIDSLNEEQLKYAKKVAEAARAAGVNPALAVSIAFKEGSLDPKTIDHPKTGAIGMMQIMPATGKAMGFSEKDLRDSDKNIQAGIKNIKEALDYTNNDPLLASIYYHSGPDALADLAAKKPMGPNAKAYINALNEFGTFDFSSEPPAPSQAPAETTTEATEEAPSDTGLGDLKILTPEQDFIRKNSAADLKRQQYGTVGGIGGAAVAAAPYVGRTAAGTVGKLVKAFSDAKQPAPAAPTGALPAGGAPMPPQTPPSAPTGGLGGQVPSVVRQAPASGYGTYNYGISQGLTDIESGLAKDMTKEAGGVHDLLTQRREGLNRLQSMGANDFVENPRFGGIMTQAPSVGGGPRESFALRAPEAGQPAQLAPIPKAAPIPTTPPPLSGLDQVKNMFTSMMRQGARLMPVVGPPLAGLSIGRDLADIQTQYERAPVERDYTDIGLSTAGALATGASLYPPAFPVAAPLSIGIPTFRNIRRNLMAQESDPEIQKFIKSEPTPEELELASRPAFRYARP